MDGPCNPLPPYPVMTLVPRPVDDKGLAFDLVELDHSPIPAVHTVIPVIPHHKKGILRDREGSKVIPRLCLPLINCKIPVNGIGFFQRLSINRHLLVVDLHHISGSSNHALDEIFTFIFRKLKDDHISSLGFAEGNQYLVREWNLDPIDELVNQDMISNIQGFDHGAGGDFKSLNHEGPDEEGQNHRNEQCLGILPEGGLLLDRRNRYSPIFKMARKASCGISTRPTCFIRFLPSFCFSHSFLFRVMSPP